MDSKFSKSSNCWFFILSRLEKNFPNKAKQANRISFLVFVVYLVGYAVYKVAGGSH